MQEIELKQETQDFRLKEAFKTLRTNIDFSGDDIKVICVTSCVPGEGKSTVSFELARSFAVKGKRTLLIDADLRKSVMKARYRKGRVRYGLTNYLAGRVTMEEALCVTDVPNFYMLFAGPVPPNPSELLGNSKFQRMINESRDVFDIIIIDTPPVGSVVDSTVVAKNCDGAVLVVSSGKISYRFARRMKEQLSISGCRILGCVLNKVKMNGKGYYGSYYGKYYGKYYGNYSNNNEL